MDTLRDKQVLEEMIERGDTPWQLSNDHAAAVNS
jgi:glucose-1-phosphate cytidylyltransferase